MTLDLGLGKTKKMGIKQYEMSRIAKRSTLDNDSARLRGCNVTDNEPYGNFRMHGMTTRFILLVRNMNKNIVDLSETKKIYILAIEEAFLLSDGIYVCIFSDNIFLIFYFPVYDLYIFFVYIKSMCASLR